MLDRLQLEGVPAQLAARIESIEQEAASVRPTHKFARERVRERLLDVRSRSCRAGVLAAVGGSCAWGGPCHPKPEDKPYESAWSARVRDVIGPVAGRPEKPAD